MVLTVFHPATDDRSGGGFSRVASARFRIKRLKHRLKLAYRWWLCPHASHRTFFVLATYRSGSNLLVDYLRRFSGLGCHSEVLLPTVPIGMDYSEHSPENARWHLQRSLQALTQEIRGCKVMLDQLESCRITVGDIQELFPEANYLILYRESLVEQFVSHRLASTTAEWRAVTDEGSRDVQLSINPAELHSFCLNTRQSYAKLLGESWLADRSVLLSYEELVADAQCVFRERICPLLGLPDQELKTQLRKQNTLPLSQRVANYDDIRALIRNPVCHQWYSWQKSSRKMEAAT